MCCLTLIFALASVLTLLNCGRVRLSARLEHRRLPGSTCVERASRLSGERREGRERKWHAARLQGQRAMCAHALAARRFLHALASRRQPCCAGPSRLLPRNSERDLSPAQCPSQPLIGRPHIRTLVARLQAPFIWLNTCQRTLDVQEVCKTRSSG